jgi:hypothetical protein
MENKYHGGIDGLAELVQLGFQEDENEPVVFATRCNVTFILQDDGKWDIDIRLPNGSAIGIEAQPEDVVLNSLPERFAAS